MQERRATIRIGQRCRAQYCPADDLVPRDGAVLNLSERGTGLEVHEAHRVGERVTVNFLLPNDNGPLTGTGVVRWSDVRTPGRRRCRMGIEWLPLEDASRSRLQQFLYASAQQPRSGRHAKLIAAAFRPAAALRRVLVLAVVITGPLIVILLTLRLLSLQTQNYDLQRLSEERMQVIGQLETQQTKLHDELGTAKTHLATTAGEVARLDQQAQQLEGSMTQLHQALGRMEGSYHQVRGEREQLTQQVAELEQARLQLTRRLRASQQLRQLILDMIRTRRQPLRRILPASPIVAADVPTDRPMKFIGNHGYVVLDGAPTAHHSILWIRVHDPIADAGSLGAAAAGASRTESPAASVPSAGD